MIINGFMKKKHTNTRFQVGMRLSGVRLISLSFDSGSGSTFINMRGASTTGPHDDGNPPKIL